jgi:hypothetical protein
LLGWVAGNLIFRHLLFWHGDLASQIFDTL